MRTVCITSVRSPQYVRYLPRQRRQYGRPHEVSSTVARCSLTASNSEAKPQGEKPTLWMRVKGVICPFEDSSANARFLALAVGGMLCSVATLIHDSYLPIFMRDELGMSNSVRDHQIGAVACVGCALQATLHGVVGSLSPAKYIQMSAPALSHVYTIGT